MKALLCLVLLISFGQVVLADQEGVSPSYTAVTPDKKHIFVMLSGGFRYGLTDRQNELYPASGMYLNDGSSFPLWTVDWTAGVYLPNGGVHESHTRPFGFP